MTDTPDGFRQITPSESENTALQVRLADADAALAREIQNEMHNPDMGSELIGASDGAATGAELDAIWEAYDAVDVHESDALRGAWGAQASTNLGLIFEFAQSPEGMALVEALPEGIRGDPGWLAVGLTLARRWKATQ